MRKLTAVSAVRRAIQRCRWRLFHTWNLRELSRTLLPSDLRKAAGSRGVRVVRVRGQQSESLCYFLRMFKAGDKKRVFVFFISWVYYILSFPSSGPPRSALAPSGSDCRSPAWRVQTWTSGTLTRRWKRDTGCKNTYGISHACLACLHALPWLSDVTVGSCHSVSPRISS